MIIYAVRQILGLLLFVLAFSLSRGLQVPGIQGETSVPQNKTFSYVATGLSAGQKAYWKLIDKNGKEVGHGVGAQFSALFSSSGLYVLSYSLFLGGDAAAQINIRSYSLRSLALVTSDGKPLGGQLAIGRHYSVKVQNKGGALFGLDDPPLKIKIQYSSDLVLTSAKSPAGTIESGGLTSLEVNAGEAIDLLATRASKNESVTLTPEVAGGGPTILSWDCENAPKKIELSRDSITLRKGNKMQIDAKVVGLDGQAIQGAAVQWPAKDSIAAFDPASGAQTTVTALAVGSATVDATYSAGGVSVKEPLSISVIAAAKSLRIAALATQLTPQGSTSATVEILDENGLPIQPTAEDPITIGFQVKSLDGNDSSPVVRVSQDSSVSAPGRFEVVGLRNGSATVTFTAKIGADGSPMTGTVDFDVVTVGSFEPVEVSLTQLDPATVRDTFGSEIDKDYYVMQVAMVNNLDTLPDGTKIDSIVVYGQSFDVAVEMVKENGQPVTDDDLVKAFTRAHANDENPYPEELEPVPVGSIEFSRSRSYDIEASGTGPSLTMEVGERVTIRLAEIPGVDFTLASSDGSVVEADPSGAPMLIAQKAGSATVTLSAVIGQQTIPATFLVNVLDPNVRSISQWVLGDSNPGAIELVAGQPYFLSAPTGNLSDYAFSTLPALSISDSGMFQGNAGSYLISATSKTDPKKIYYAYLHFSSASESVTLPPSVFAGGSGPLRITARLRYRPVSQELVLLAQDLREARSPESNVRRWADFGLRILGWAVVAHEQLHSPSLTRGDLVPGLIALGPEAISTFLPDESQAHRNAILTEGMREFESIPHGGQLHKVLFFPKKYLDGYLPKMKVRIASVDSSSFRISVGVVVGTASLNQQNTKPVKPGTPGK